MRKKWRNVYGKGDTKLTDKITTADLFDCQVPYLRALFAKSVYPWEVLQGLTAYLRELTRNGIEGFCEVRDGVWAGEGVTIAPTATIQGTAILGRGTEVRPGAFLRGDVVCGKDCTIGNSTELKHCVLLDDVQVPHYNYVGDSVLGNRAHMGAGAVCSNLKSGGGAVTVHGVRDYETGMRKLGGILADGADVGCGCVCNPGTVVGVGTSVYPLTALRGVYPSQSIVKTATEVVVRR